MNKKYIAIALLLAGATFTAPAFAGSVNTTGGNKTSSKTIDNVYTKYNYETRYVTNTVYINNTVNETVTQQGDDIVTNKTVNKQGKDEIGSITGSVSCGSKGLGSYDYTGQYSNVSQSTINDIAVDLVEKGRANCTSNSGKHTFGDNGQLNNAYVTSDGKVKADGYRCDDSYGKATYGQIDNVDITKDTRVDTKTKTKDLGQTVESTTSSSSSTSTESFSSSSTSQGNCTTTDKLTNIKYTMSNNAIMIGDSDNYNNAYVAQGSVDKGYHFDRTNTYTIINTVYTTNYVTTTTTNTTTNTVHNNYQVTTTNTSHDVYSLNVDASVTPIVLDLDGDGRIEASNGNYLPHYGDFTKNTVLFDFYGNGFPVACEWVGANDGLLCRPNADGSVYGTNLFGSANGYDNGFDELSTLDTDNNGLIEGKELADLMVWTDTNRNGIADKGELKSVQELGITSIGVSHENLSGNFTRNGQVFKTFDWCPGVAQLRKAEVASR